MVLLSSCTRLRTLRHSNLHRSYSLLTSRCIERPLQRRFQSTRPQTTTPEKNSSVQTKYSMMLHQFFSVDLIVSAYPHNLLIYSSGTARTFGVAAVKVTILISFLVNITCFVAP